jgi:hypothetical protein
VRRSGGAQRGYEVAILDPPFPTICTTGVYTLGVVSIVEAKPSSAYRHLVLVADVDDGILEGVRAVA